MVAFLVALAAVNKIRLTPALRRGAPGAAPALGRTIGAEIALVAAILVATAALGTAPPPRAIIAGSGSHASHQGAGRDAGLSITVLSAGRSAEIVLESARSGVNRAEIMVLDRTGAAIDAAEVIFIAANRTAGVEPIRRAGMKSDSGAWHVDDLLLVPAGEWSVRLDVLVSDFEKVAFETSFDLH